jgi:hypothetical protein
VKWVLEVDVFEALLSDHFELFLIELHVTLKQFQLKFHLLISVSL